MTPAAICIRPLMDTIKQNELPTYWYDRDHNNIQSMIGTQCNIIAERSHLCSHICDTNVTFIHVNLIKAYH